MNTNYQHQITIFVNKYKILKREIIQTKDGSTTIFFPDINETYHSKFGAIQEAYHVFIKMGFETQTQESLSILEVGFGTGLNAFITFLEAKKTNKIINYVGVDAYPVSLNEISKMNFVTHLDAISDENVFNSMHNSIWNEKIVLSKNFVLTKRQQFFQEINDINSFDLIYFDAFGYRIEPELWSIEIFKKMYDALKPQGVLVTYACRSSIKNDMIALGFEVEKLPGAPGKREMLRATKV